MVRCRQKCTNSFPVPHGYAECTGSYEDDKCTVHCDDDYKLQGDSKILCKGGVWENQDAKPASAQCKDIGVCQLISHEHSEFIDRSHITVVTMVYQPRKRQPCWCNRKTKPAGIEPFISREHFVL